MEPLDYTLAWDIHYYDVTQGMFLPKLSRLDHYSSFNEAFIELRTRPIGNFNINMVEKDSLSYYISDAVIAFNKTGEIIAKLTRTPWSPEITDIHSRRYNETILIEGGLSHMKEPLLSATLAAHKNSDDDRFIIGVYAGSQRKLSSSFEQYRKDLAKMHDRYYLDKQIFRYRNVTESPVPDQEDIKPPVIEQFFHCADIKDALAWMLFHVLGKPGTTPKLSDEMMPRFNTISVIVLNEIIADTFLQLGHDFSTLSGKGLYLSFRSDANYVEIAYEIPLLKALQQEQVTATFKIADLLDDGNTLKPTPAALALRDSLLGPDQLELKHRVRTGRPFPPDIDPLKKRF